MKDVTHEIRIKLLRTTSLHDFTSVEFGNLRTYHKLINIHERFFRIDVNEGVAIWSQLKTNIEGNRM